MGSRESTGLQEMERSGLASAWPECFEELSRELRALAPALGLSLGEELEEALAEDLGPSASPQALARAQAGLERDPELLRTFQEACEGLIEAELDERGGEWFFQLAVDILHLLPSLAAGLVIVKTGGLGSDLVVGGAGAISSLLAEKLSRLLGTQVARRARDRWRRLRGDALAEISLEAALPRSLPLLRSKSGQRRELAGWLHQNLEAMSWSVQTHRN